MEIDPRVLDDSKGSDAPRSEADQETAVGLGSAPSAGLPRGTRVRYIGDYEILSEIARGGMGVVYRARQIRLRRAVALKMMLAADFASPADIQRFRLEAEAAARLDHPHIVPIYEVGEDQGRHYFSMGYVDGPSLAARLVDGPLSARSAAELVRVVAEAVQYAHAQGVIHRDLKPGNILLDRQQQPRITDFGLAKQLRAGGEALTGTGQILGTPSYMPPEQALGDQSQVGEPADIYALGGILYAALTGRPPFQSDNPLTTLRQVIEQEPVSPRQLNPAVPADLETICLKCLRKQAARRYASAQDLADDLGRYLAGKPIWARPVGRLELLGKWCRRNRAVASLLVAITATLFLGVTLTSYFAWDARRRQAENFRVKERNEAVRLSAQANADAAQRDAHLALERQRQAVAEAIRLRLEEARVFCERGDAAEGLLRMAAAMERAEQLGDPNLVDACRAMASLWLAQIPRLQKPLLDAEQPVSAAYGAGDLTVWVAGFAPMSQDASRDALELARARAFGLRALDARTADPLSHVPDLCSPVRPLALSSDQTRMLLRDAAGLPRLWSLTDRDWVGPPLAVASPLRRAQFLPIARLLATQGEVGEPQFWHAADGQPAAPPAAGELRWGENASSATFDGEWQAIAAADRVRWARSSEEGFEAAEIHAPGRVASTQFSLAGAELLVVTEQGMVETWDAPPKVNPRFQQLAPTAEAVRFRVDATQMLVVGPGRFQSLRRIKANEDASVIPLLPEGTIYTEPDPTDQFLVGLTAKGQFFRMRLADRSLVTAPVVYPHKPLKLMFSRRGDAVALLTAGLVGLHRLTDLAPLGEPIGAKPLVSTARFSDDGRWFFVTDQDWEKRWLRRVDEGRDVDLNVEYGLRASRLLLHPDGKRFLIPKGGAIELLEGTPPRSVRTIKVGEGLPRWTEYLADGRQIVVTTDEGVVRVFDWETGRQVRESITGAGSTTLFQIRPDGQWLATYDPLAENLALVHWHLPTGRRLGSPPLGLARQSGWQSIPRIEYAADSRSFVVNDSRNAYVFLDPPSDSQGLRALAESWTGLTLEGSRSKALARGEWPGRRERLLAAGWHDPAGVNAKLDLAERVEQLCAEARLLVDANFALGQAIPLLRHARLMQETLLAQQPQSAAAQAKMGEICLLLGRDYSAARNAAEATPALQLAAQHYQRAMELEAPTADRLAGWGIASQGVGGDTTQLDNLLARLAPTATPLAEQPAVLTARGIISTRRFMRTSDAVEASRFYDQALDWLERSYELNRDHQALRWLGMLVQDEMVKNWKSPTDSPRYARTLAATSKSLAWAEELHRARADLPGVSYTFGSVSHNRSFYLASDQKFSEAAKFARRGGDIYHDLIERGFGKMPRIHEYRRTCYSNAIFWAARSEVEPPRAELEEAAALAESVLKQYREYYRGEKEYSAPWLYSGLGIVRLRLGDARGALEALDASLKYSGKREASDLFWRAAALEQLGEETGAEADWQEAEDWVAAFPDESPWIVKWDREWASRYRRPPSPTAPPMSSPAAPRQPAPSTSEPAKPETRDKGDMR